MEQRLFSIGKTAKQLGVSIDTIRRWDQEGILKSFRPSATSNRYFRKEDIDMFLEKSNPVGESELISLAKKWVTSESGFPISSSLHCRTSDIFNGRLDNFAMELNLFPELKESFPLVVAITGEIGNNSFNHNLGNWPDTPGLLFGYDIRKKHLVLADRGQGVLKTLKGVLPDLKDDEEALHVAFTQYVSGRAPENRGNGLKFVKDVVVANPFSLQFYSGHAILNLDQEHPVVIVKKSDATVHGCLAILSFSGRGP